MRQMTCFGTVVFLLISVLAVTPLHAQTPPSENLFNRNAKPLDINSIPVLSNLTKIGAKLYYLGERSGLHGWFIVKDGQIQMIYVTSDGKTSIIGGMFTGEGDNVTGPQIKALVDANKEVNDLVNSTARQQEDIARVGGVPGGFAAVPGGTGGGRDQTLANNLPAVPLSPGERLYQDLQAAAGVTLGRNDTAEILMVIDPDCPHCKGTWSELRESVQANRVQVRLIPISGNMSGPNVEAASQLLRAPNPLEAWEKHLNGDKSALQGGDAGVHMQAVLANRSLIDRWNIKETPYLVYRAKDGRVKIVKGKPDRMAAVLTDLLR